jgi:hypothetical protein
MLLVLQYGFSCRRPSWNRDYSSPNIVWWGVSVRFVHRVLFDDDRRASPQLVTSTAVLSSLTKALATVACRTSRLAHSFAVGGDISVAAYWCCGWVGLRVLPRREHAALASWARLAARAIVETKTTHAADKEVFVSWQVEARIRRRRHQSWSVYTSRFIKGLQTGPIALEGTGKACSRRDW